MSNEPPKEGEVLPPGRDDSDAELEKLKAIVESIAVPLLDAAKVNTQAATEQLQMQLGHADRIDLRQSILTGLIIAVAALFCWKFIEGGRTEVAERIVYVLLGFGLGVFGRRNR